MSSVENIDWDGESYWGELRLWHVVVWYFKIPYEQRRIFARCSRVLSTCHKMPWTTEKREIAIMIQ